jgi:hypothetical protein
MEIKLSRLLIVILLVIIPVTIFIAFYSVNFSVSWFPEGDFKQILLQWVAPIMFTIAWIYIIIMFATRLSDSIDIMNKTSTTIPMRYRFFFGLNALFILVLFVFPLITPFIAAFAFSSMIFRLLTLNQDWDLEPKVKTITKILTSVFAAIPILISVMVIPSIVELTYYLWNSVWIPIITPLFLISLVLGTTLNIQAFVILMREGVSEYEQVLDSGEDEQFLYTIYGVSVLIFGFLLFLQFMNIEFVNIIHAGGLILAFLTWIINFIKGRQNNKLNLQTIGYLLWFIFFAWANSILDETSSTVAFMRTTPLSFLFPPIDIARTWIITISGGLFIIIFMLIFFRHPDLDKEE